MAFVTYLLYRRDSVDASCAGTGTPAVNYLLRLCNTVKTHQTRLVPHLSESPNEELNLSTTGVNTGNGLCAMSGAGSDSALGTREPR